MGQPARKERSIMKKCAIIAALAVLLVSFAAAQPAANKFSLKLYGGGTYGSGGDFAKGIQGQSDYLAESYAVSGSYAFPKLGWLAGGELLIPLSSRISLGLGAGFERHANSKAVSYDIGAIAISETLAPKFTVLPVTGMLHWSLPLGGAIKIDVALGGGVYLTKMNWDYAFDMTVLSYSGRDAYNFTSKTQMGYGGQAGLGLELGLSSGISLVLQVLGRYVVVPEFEGSWTDVGTGDFWTYSDSGNDHIPWFYNWTFAGATYPQLLFQADEPSGTTVSDARKAKLDLNGVAATIGIKIKLF
jgi:hypothetical protein